MLILIHDTHRVGGWEQELHLGKCSVERWGGAEWAEDESRSWVCGQRDRCGTWVGSAVAVGRGKRSEGLHWKQEITFAHVMKS